MKSRPGRVDQLREQAERALSSARRPLQSIEPQHSIEQALHELEVYQVELEIQNEELRRLQDELIESRDRYVGLYELAPVGYFILDKQWRISEANVTAADLLGVESNELLGKPLSRFLVESEAEAFHLYKQSITPGKNRVPFEGWFRRPSGDLLRGFIETVIRDADSYLVALIDMTGRRVAEDKLQDRESRLAVSSFRFSQIAERITDVFYVTEPVTNKPLYLSPAFETVFGRSVSEGMNLTRGWLPWVHPADQERVAQAVAGASQGKAYDEEYRILRPDGTVCLVRDRCFPGEAIEVTGMIHDVTQERAVEDDLRRAQRMEALGTLASGIAHDFNNLLMGIAGYAHLALQTLQPKHPAYDFIYRSLGSVMRGASLTRQLVGYGDRREHDEKSLYIDRIVMGARDLLSRLMGDHIEVEVEAGAPGKRIVGDAGEIEQILMNLASNARDAMPEGGTLRINTEVRTAEGEENSIPDETIVLSVTDTGCGMTPETKAHVFDPFFTTKEVGKGTGLGLATVFSVIRRLGGQVSVDSEPGAGTTFTFKLPVSQSEAADADEVGSAKAMSGQGETILVVDDDHLVRATVQSYLETLGYRVILSPDPEHAIGVCRREGEGIDVMITDMMMPGRLGGDLAKVIHSTCPSMRVLFMSAHAPADLVRLGRLEANAPVLTKPFDIKALGLALRRLIESQQVQKDPLTPRGEACDVEEVAAPHDEPNGMRVLIVDDDPDVADTLQMCLEFEGYEARVANNGTDALKEASEFNPDVVMCDLNLGTGMNGYDVARALRANPRMREACVVALTGYDAQDLTLDAEHAGFDRVFTKPIDPGQLKTLLADRRAHTCPALGLDHAS